MSRLKPALLLALGALIVTTSSAHAAGPGFALKKLGFLRSFEGLVMLPSRDPRDDRNGMGGDAPPIAKLSDGWGGDYSEQTWSVESDSRDFTEQPATGNWQVETATGPGIPAPNGPVSSHGLTLAP